MNSHHLGAGCFRAFGVIFAASTASLAAPGLTMLNYPGEIWLRGRLAQTAAKINSHD